MKARLETAALFAFLLNILSMFLPLRGAFAPLEKALTIRPLQSPVKLEVRLRFALRSCYSAASESHRDRGRAEIKAKVASRVAAKITDPSYKNLSLS